MKRMPFIALLLAGLLLAGTGWAQSSAQGQSGQSLADIARKLKEQQGQKSSTVGKTFTNDDLPGAGAATGVSVETGGSESSAATPDASEDHGEKYFRKAYAKLMGRKEMDERELEVLQKKLNQNDVQYYSDPQVALQQQYSRSDIAKNQDAIDKKKKDIADVDQALSDLQDELRRDGGNPSWIQGAPVSIEPDVPDQKLPDDPAKASKEYWQTQFKSARATLAHAEEAQKLVEDEINFLKQRQVQEPSPDAQAEINSKLADRQAEMDKATAVTDKAKQNLDELQKAFDASGAPKEWSASE
jgi:hypothetical protein